MGRHIRKITLVPAMDPSGQATTARTFGTPTERMGRYDHFIRSNRDLIHDKAGRQQPGSLP